MCFELHALWLYGRMYHFSEHCPARCSTVIFMNSTWWGMNSMLYFHLGPNAKTFCEEMPNCSLSKHTYKQTDEVLKVTCGMCSPSPVEEAGDLWRGSYCLLLIVRINNRYSEHKLFIGPDPVPHKSTEVTRAIF